VKDSIGGVIVMVSSQAVLSSVRQITIRDLKKHSKAFVQNEQRGYIYPDALNKVQNNFGIPTSICAGISDLLCGWHNNFYHFGSFDQAEVLKSVKLYHKKLKEWRIENIRHVQLDSRFMTQFSPIFHSFLDATAGKNSRFTRRTVTGTSKCLHLLAPDIFPMCDEAISQAYCCWWVYSDFGFSEYSKFMGYMKTLAEQLVTEYSKRHNIHDLDRAETQLVNEVKTYSGDTYQYGKSLLKIIDEYNYTRYTKKWS
jgi:hypothetical protein